MTNGRQGKSVAWLHDALRRGLKQLDAARAARMAAEEKEQQIARMVREIESVLGRGASVDIRTEIATQLSKGRVRLRDLVAHLVAKGMLTTVDPRRRMSVTQGFVARTPGVRRVERGIYTTAGR